ncbi:MAG TPA: cytochrome c biogenesis protein ResB, partial [Planctomycetota bacterium]
LTLMIGVVVTFNSKIYGDLQAVEGSSYEYFTIENQNEILVSTSDRERASFPISYNPYGSSTERRTFKLPNAPVYLHVEEFLPNVVLDPTYRLTPNGIETVAEIALHQPGQDPKRTVLKLHEPATYGPLAFLAMDLTDTAFANLSEPSGEEGTLVITIDGETREIDLAREKETPVRVGGAQVTVLSWGLPGDHIPDFWVRFEVSRSGRPAETWEAQAFNTEASPRRISSPGAAAPPDFKARLRPRYKVDAIHGPGVAGAVYLCRTGSVLRYLFLNSKGQREAGPLENGRKLKYPFMALPMEIELIQWMDKAEEIAVPTEVRKSTPRNPALRLTVESENHRDTQWVKFFSDGARFAVGDRRILVVFQGKRYRDLPFTLTLEDFRVEFNKGTQSPKKFESDVTLQDHETGEVTKATIEVNTPMKYKGFVIYQASWNPNDPRVSIFQISKDPGKKIIYLGWVMAISGAIFMFFLKPFLQRLLKAGHLGTDAPLASSAALVLFALTTLGTIGGMLGPLVLPRVDALWLGLGIAGADLVLALIVVLIARAWVANRPVRALQTGEILSAGWCLNTAALVILLMMKVTA